jgi:serine/threonine protein kinase
MPLNAGDKLGPYEILVLIGAGAMGEVYRATDTQVEGRSDQCLNTCVRGGKMLRE